MVAIVIGVFIYCKTIGKDISHVSLCSNTSDSIPHTLGELCLNLIPLRQSEDDGASHTSEWLRFKILPRVPRVPSVQSPSVLSVPSVPPSVPSVPSVPNLPIFVRECGTATKPRQDINSSRDPTIISVYPVEGDDNAIPGPNQWPPAPPPPDILD